MKKLKFKNGDSLDAIGLGTWKSEKGEVTKAVKTALENGYKHIDCAAVYGNEAEVGDAFAEVFKNGKVKREDVWITSKLWKGGCNTCPQKNPEGPAAGLPRSLSYSLACGL